MQRFIILFLLFLSVVSRSYTQENKLPEKVSITATNIAFDELLKDLSQKYSIHFFYSASKIPVQKKVTIDASDITLDEALAELCRQMDIVYRKEGNQIILIPSEEANKSKLTSISGYITDSITGERLIGANIIFPDIDKGTVTNNYGYYTYSLPNGSYNIKCSYMGYNTIDTVVDVLGQYKHSFRLTPQFLRLKEIKLGSSQKDKTSKIMLGSDALPLSLLKTYPALLGENDIVQFLKMMPGVQTTTDGLNGLFIRGSMPQHTSFLIDDAPMLNMYHFSGWFSTINPDAVKDVKLYKSHLPAKTGGSLSSIVDIRLRDGNNQKYMVTGGLGSITSRLTVEGPIVRDKASFIVSGRRSYIDQVIKAFNLEKDVVGLNNIYFFDLNAKVNYTVNYKNRLYLSSYLGRDIVNESEGTSWGNSLLSARWNHLFSYRLFSNFTLTASNYTHQFSGFDSDNMDYRFFIVVKNYSVKYDFTYYTKCNNKFYFGANTMYQVLPPVKYEGSIINEMANTGNSKTQSQVTGNIYLQGEISLTQSLSVEPGIRLVLFNKIYPRDMSTKILPSPSLILQYKLNNNVTLKSGYSHNYQFYHGASVFELIIPFERYLLSGGNLEYQYADHFSSGFYFFNRNKNIEFCFEPYLSFLRNQYRFPLNTDIIVGANQDIPSLLGKTNAYGMEYSLRKLSGKFTGLISYTWAKADKKEEGVNNGEYFNPYYDRRHDLVFNATYQLKRRMQFTATWVYMSGSPYSLPVGKYELRGRTVPLYDNNKLYNLRMPVYHRLDIGIRFQFKKRKHYEHSLMLMAYNAYARKNPVFYTYRDVADGDLNKNPNINYITRNFSMMGYYFFGFVPAFSYEFKFE